MGTNRICTLPYGDIQNEPSLRKAEEQRDQKADGPHRPKYPRAGQRAAEHKEKREDQERTRQKEPNPEEDGEPQQRRERM